MTKCRCANSGDHRPAEEARGKSHDNAREAEIFRVATNSQLEAETPTPPHPHQEIIDALRALELRRLDQLCDRLGIDNTLSESERWMRVGMILAQNEPEFAAQTGRRGRPPKPRQETDDVRRARLVQLAATDWYNSPDFDGRELPVTEWVELYIEFGRGEHVDLFKKAGKRSIENSVSRGLKELDIDLKKITKK